MTDQSRELFLKEVYEMTTDVLQGDLPKAILDDLETHKAYLPVLGSKGLTGPERFQMGSLSEWLAGYAAYSVLVVCARVT